MGGMCSIVLDNEHVCFLEVMVLQACRWTCLAVWVTMWSLGGEALCAVGAGHGRVIAWGVRRERVECAVCCRWLA